MAGTVIWSAELDKRMHYTSKTFPDFKGYKFSVSVDKDVAKLLEEDKDGPRQQQFMVDDANEALKDAVSAIEGALKTVDAAMPKAGSEKDQKVLTDACRKTIDETLAALARTLEAVPEKRWDTWVKIKKDYKKYKIKSAVSVVTGSIGAIASVASLAVAVPTGGATLALSIVGLIRSSVELAQTLTRLWVEAETVQQKLTASCDALSRLYQTHGKAALGAASTGSTVLNVILGVDAAPNLKTLESENALWEQKLNGIDVNAGEAARKALEALDKAETLEKKLHAAKSDQAGKLLDALRKVRKSVNDHLDACHKQSERCHKGRQLQETYAVIVKQLKSDQPAWSAVFDKLIPAAASLALAGANAGNGLKDAKEALEIAKESAVLVIEVAKTLKEAAD